MKTAVILALLSGACAAADLAAVRSEPNLEKRSDRALLNAEKALDEARKFMQEGETAKMNGALGEVRDSIVLSRESLEATGKNARRKPKYFKKAEIGIRKLIRRLENFKVEASVDDREPVEKLIKQATELREEIMHMILGKK